MRDARKLHCAPSWDPPRSSPSQCEDRNTESALSLKSTAPTAPMHTPMDPAPPALHRPPMCNHVDPSTRNGSSPCAASPPNANRARLLRTAAAALLCLVGPACKTPPAPESTSDRFDTFETTPDWSVASLGVGDLIRVTVVGHPELSTPDAGSHLDRTGAVALPTVGSVDLAGLDLAEANERVHDAYAKFMHEPNLTVDLVSRDSKLYHVIGQIREPGRRVLDRPTTALEAVGAGGFFLNAADRSHIFILRAHGEELEVHEFNAETPGVDGLVQVQPGDIVFVRRRGAQIFQEEVLPLLAPFNLALPSIVAAGDL